jgi:outer membrane protein
VRTARIRTSAALVCVLGGTAALAQDQLAEIQPQKPKAPVVIRPYLTPGVPTAPLMNPGSFANLIRAGRMYLTAQDTIALALANNIDIEVARYAPINLAWTLERFEAGGALPGVPNNASQAVSVANGQGVLGSQASAGVSAAGNNGQVGASTNTTVTQIGPVTPTLDPSIQEASTFSHRSIPQSNSVQSQTSNLILNQRVYLGSYQEGFLTGGTINVSYNDHYLNENAPTDNLNPSVAPSLSFTIQHNLLSGFGIKVNERSIEVAKINLNASDLNFRTRVSGVITNVLNAYYQLAGDFEDLRAKQHAVETAETTVRENSRRLDLGALAQLDVTTSQNQLAAARQSLVNSQSAMRQDELTLKNLISRTGLGDPVIAEAQIIPLDRIVVPAADNLPPAEDLIKRAIANRSDLLAEKENLKATEVSNLGTKSGLLPLGVGLASTSNAGLAGRPKPVPVGVAGMQPPVEVAGVQPPDPYYIGGMGTALGQIFRHNFPSESVGAFFKVPFNNRQAQADYGVDQLSLRQQQLSVAKDSHQAEVDVMNAYVAMQQARARYEAAVQSRILSEQLLEAEQKKFAAGESTTSNVAAQQRDLLAAQASELDVEVTWQGAKIALDQMTGMTLEANHITLAEAKSGKTVRTPELPANLPETLTK